MRVRRVEIQNFRGIKNLDFRVPADKKFVCLVGPGDSAKSTIIDAIHLALGDRWSLSLNDTDFYGGELAEPFIIRVAVSDLTAEIRGHSLLGLHLAGIDAAGEWHHDPADGLDPCVVVQLKVDQDMEPAWTIHRPGGIEEVPIGSGVRRKFQVFKVDDRIDNHLRWTRTSALTRITDATHGTSATLSTAIVAARAAVDSAVTPELRALTEGIGARLGELGSGDFKDLRPGLDTSLSTSGGNLALFDGKIPLTSFGLGTKRLAGIATQEMASENKSIILIDEVEHGLEPHRLVHLLKHLRSDAQHAQVFVTTHSPVAVEQLDSADLAIVRNLNGAATARLVPPDLALAQATLRGGPSAFLARKIVVTEGKTEFGLLLGLVEHWDRVFVKKDMPTSAAFGTAITNGNGANAPGRAKVLAELGYATALFYDNDVRDADAAVAEAVLAGVQAIQWDTGNATEEQLVAEMDAALLTKLLQVAVKTRANAATVKADLRNAGSKVQSLEVGDWITADFSIEQARDLIASTAKKSKWFKAIPAGRTLSKFVMENAREFKGTTFAASLVEVKKFVYSPPAAPGEEE